MAYRLSHDKLISLLASGHTINQIAYALKLNRFTVYQRLKALMVKHDALTHCHLIHIMTKQGLIND